jgi:UDP-N-acetylmuramate dehydrogenase
MTISQRHIHAIRDRVSGKIVENVPLRDFTYFRIGGPADLLVEPQNREELAELVKYLNDEAVSRLFLGSGTNVLVSDAGFPGVVIRLTGLKGFTLAENGSDRCRLTVGAGLSLPAVIKRSCDLGWKGIEPLWGIPGSFGGAIVTNAGAGGLSIGDILLGVELLTQSGQEVVLERDEIHCEYRYTKIPSGSAVLEGTVRLVRGESDELEAFIERTRLKRHAGQPWDRPSAGCVFKNPSPENPAGALIDRLGFKGRAVGDAQVSDIHANFIINRGNATAAQVLELIEMIRAEVKKEHGIDLQLEIRLIGEPASDV